MAGFLIALLSGALMSVQGVFNTQVTKSTGIWVSNGWVQLSAFALCVVVWLATGRESVSTLWEVRPHYMLLGGVIGAGITWTVIQSVSALGPARSALLIVIAQLAVSYPALRTFRNGSGAILVEKGRRTSSGGGRNYDLSAFRYKIRKTGKCFCQILRSVTNVIHL